MDYLSSVRVLDTDYKIKDEEAARINHTHKIEEIEGAAKEGHKHQASEIDGLSALVTEMESDPTVPTWAKQPTKPDYDFSEIKNATPISIDYINSL